MSAHPGSPDAALAGALLACLVCAGACTRDPSPGGGAVAVDALAPAASVIAAPSASSAPAVVAPSTTTPLARMTVFDTGKAPRRSLRYVWRVSQGETLTLDLRTAASTEESGGAKQPEIPLPPVHVVLTIDPQSVSPEGELTYAWHVASTRVVADVQTPQGLVDGMRAEVAAIEHLSGSAAVTSRGLATRVTIDTPPPTGKGNTGQMVEQIRQTLRDVAAPLPEEPIGRGARWEKLSQLTSQDARVTQTETFTLVDVSPTGGALDDVLAQTAPAQPLPGPSTASGGQARMESMLASGDGKVRFDLGRLVPQTKFDGTTTMVVSGRAQADDARRVTMIMRVGIEIAGGTR